MQTLAPIGSGVLTKAFHVPFTGEKLNLADLTVFAVTSAIKKGQWDFIGGEVLEPYPGLCKHHDTVLVHPMVVEHAIYM